MHGKTFAMVSVAAVVLALVFSLALPIEATSDEVPALQLEENAVEPETHLGFPSCLLCLTCGGYWPIFKFSIVNQFSNVAILAAECGGSNPISSWWFGIQPNYCCDF
jgi:hypothetical protein